MVHFIISSLNPSHGSLRCHDWDISNQNPPQLSIISIKHKFGNTKPCPFFHAISPGVVNLPPSLNCLLVDYFRKGVKQVHVWLRVRMCDWGCTCVTEYMCDWECTCVFESACVIECTCVIKSTCVIENVHVWQSTYVWLRVHMCDWECTCVVENVHYLYAGVCIKVCSNCLLTYLFIQHSYYVYCCMNTTQCTT